MSDQPSAISNQPIVNGERIVFADGWCFRFVGPGDAEIFPQWIAGNQQISWEDALAATKERNPSNTFLFIEHEGVPVLCLPAYLVMRIGYLCFNPQADKQERETAMEHMLKALRAFAMIYSIGTIDVLTKSGIPVAEWARAHGFVQDPRELFKLELNHLPETKIP